METKICERCGTTLIVGEGLRYEVRIEVRAAYDPLEITGEALRGDPEEEIRRLLAQLEGISEEEATDQVHREFRFDLCPPCQREYLRDPLGRSPRSQGPPAS